MSGIEWLRGFSAWGIPFGLLLGLALGPVVHREGFGGYADLRRRAVRLGHIAAVMLPLIGGFYAIAASTWRPGVEVPALASLAYVGGAVGLVLVLLLTGFVPRARWWLPLPALLVVAGTVGFAVTLRPM